MREAPWAGDPAQLPLPVPGQLAGWLPDETLFSWCSRYHRQTANGRAEATCRQLFGHHQQGSAHDLPARIDDFVERTGGILGDADELIRRRTLLPFYLPCRSAERGKQAMLLMRGPGIGSLKYQLGMLTSGLGADHPLKACPACMAAERAQFGVAYWHLAHQLPSTWVCPVHGLALLQTGLKCQQLARFQWVLPQDAFPDAEQEPWVGAAGVDRRLGRMAELGLSLMGAAPGAFASATSLARAFRSGLARLGLVSAQGRLRWASIEAAFRQHLDEGRGGPGHAALWSLSAESGLRRILDGRALTHPIRYITLIEWLFDDWAAFEAAFRSGQCAAPAPASGPPHESCDPHPDKAAALAMLRRGDVSVTAVAQALDLDYLTVAAWASAVSIAPRRRPKVLRSEVLQPIVEGLGAGRDKADVAREAGVSVSTVNRVLRTEPGLADQWHRVRMSARRVQARANWQAALDRLPGVSLRLVRQLVRADHAWLYRHDRTWLQQTIARRPSRPARSNHAAARMRRHDQTLAAVIERTAAQLVDGGQTVRVRWEDLVAALPVLRRRQASLDRYPRTLRVLERLLT